MGNRQRGGRRGASSGANAVGRDSKPNVVPANPISPLTVALGAAALGAALLGGLVAAGTGGASKTMEPRPLPPDPWRQYRKLARRREWDGQNPLAERLAAAKVPALIANYTAQMPRLSWGDDLTKLSRKLPGGVLTSVFRHNRPRFGPFYDAARPLGRLVTVSRRRVGYATNATLDRAAFLAAFGEVSLNGAPRSRSAAGDYYFYSGALAEALGQQAEFDLDPGLDELLALNPAHSSINLWIGQPEVTTPCHYDGYHNLYVQLHGTKRFLLLPPSADQVLQIFPFLHPSYGQCQREPLKHFERAGGEGSVDGRAIPRGAVVAELEPGDVLYIPPLWLHEATATATSVSVNVWTGIKDDATMNLVMQVQLPSPLSVSGDSWEYQPFACRQRALAGSLLLRVVLRNLLGGAAPARELVESLLEYRYRPLLDVGELALPTDASKGLRGLGEDVRAELENRGDAVLDVEAYAARVLPLLGSLESHEPLWLANYVEFVALSSSPLVGLVAFLENLITTV